MSARILTLACFPTPFIYECRLPSDQPPESNCSPRMEGSKQSIPLKAHQLRPLRILSFAVQRSVHLLDNQLSVTPLLLSLGLPVMPGLVLRKHNMFTIAMGLVITLEGENQKVNLYWAFGWNYFLKKL